MGKLPVSTIYPLEQTALAVRGCVEVARAATAPHRAATRR
jgi:hypothetical protein